MTYELKTYGVAHTDIRIVDFIVQSSIDLLKKNGVGLQEIRALDPFTGDGVFLEALLSHNVGYVSAYEIRPEQCEITCNKYSRRVDIYCVDTFKMKPRNYNLIIGTRLMGNARKIRELTDAFAKHTAEVL